MTDYSSYINEMRKMSLAMTRSSDCDLRKRINILRNQVYLKKTTETHQIAQIFKIWEDYERVPEIARALHFRDYIEDLDYIREILLEHRIYSTS